MEFLAAAGANEVFRVPHTTHGTGKSPTVYVCMCVCLGEEILISILFVFSRFAYLG